MTKQQKEEIRQAWIDRRELHKKKIALIDEIDEEREKLSPRSLSKRYGVTVKYIYQVQTEGL